MSKYQKVVPFYIADEFISTTNKSLYRERLRPVEHKPNSVSHNTRSYSQDTLLQLRLRANKLCSNKPNLY